MSKYRAISGPYFPVFGPDITPYLDTFHTAAVAVIADSKYKWNEFSWQYKHLIKLIQNFMLTCKFPSEPGLMSCSCQWSLVLLECCYVKLKIWYHASIKTLHKKWSFLWIWSHLLKKSLMENLIFLLSETSLYGNKRPMQSGVLLRLYELMLGVIQNFVFLL